MAHHSHDDLHVHLLSKSFYYRIFGLLVVLTIITVAAAQVDFGNWNIVVAMLIASVKAGVVALFFMHLKYENPLVWMYITIPLILLFVMIGGIFIDNPLRIDGDPGNAKVEVNKSVQPPAPTHH